MGAETQNQGLAGGAASRLQSSQAAREGIQQRQAAIRNAERSAAPQAAPASMFPGEAPGTAAIPGLEEATFRRAERGPAPVAPGGAVERGAPLFGASFGGAGQGTPNRSGIVFGPGRATRMPEPGTPEYEQLLQRVRGMGAG
jgi:hypothetical protein